jgi:hypothetical protein
MGDRSQVPRQYARFYCKTRLHLRTSQELPFLNPIHLPGSSIDPYRHLFDDEGMMTTVEFSTPRRSARIFRRMKMQAQGRAHNGKKFRETCQTLVVSAHGGLLTLKHEVDNGELLTITNPETQEEIECRIVFLGDLCEGGQRVGIEFLTPAPHFWGLEFADPAPSNGESSTMH